MAGDWDGIEERQPTLPDCYGSSPEFYARLRAEYPTLLVPEHEIVMVQAEVAWTTAAEAPPAGCCPSCGDRIGPGSRLYCPRCQASGFEEALARQIGLSGLPRPDPPPPPVSDEAPRTRGGRAARKRRRAARLAARP